METIGAIVGCGTMALVVLALGLCMGLVVTGHGAIFWEGEGRWSLIMIGGIVWWLGWVIRGLRV